MILDLIILSAVFLILIGLIVGMVLGWKPHRPMTDQELYGMSSEAFELTKLGDEQFIHFYGQEKYLECVKELDALKKKSDEL